MFTLPAFDPVTAPQAIAPRGSFGRWHSRVRKLPEFAGELPVAALAEEILAEGAGQIKALVTHAGNPVLSTPNGRELDRALESLEFMVSIDFYVNETTRHAHIILPPTGPLERGHYDLAFHLLAVRNVAKFSPPLFETNGEQRHDWEIFLELQTRMESGALLGWVKRGVGKRFLGPETILDLGLRFGPHGDKFNPLSAGLNLRKLKQAVHGIDFGPLTPGLRKRLCTPDKRVHLAPGEFVKDIARLREWEGQQRKYLACIDSEERTHSNQEAGISDNGHLLLIGRRHLRSNNSWLHNTERLVKGKPRCTMLIHPEDAADRGFEEGQTVKVQSETGSIEIACEISDEMMRGVVSIPHGWGHDRKGIQLAVAQQHPGQSINDVTDNRAVDELCGTAAFNGTPVTVEML
jgi:anaerobic selenocysteine-containing dehydrogenase